MGGAPKHGREIPRTPATVWRDFNVTLVAEDRPNGAGGRDPGLMAIKNSVTHTMLQEMGPRNCSYTWSKVTEYVISISFGQILMLHGIGAAIPYSGCYKTPSPATRLLPILW